MNYFFYTGFESKVCNMFDFSPGADIQTMGYITITGHACSKKEDVTSLEFACLV